jgi:NADH-quinone oxidoreductase subunit L
MTHAFFKALLFLCSGSVIHAMAGQQDMRHMGSLKKYMPITYATMLIGTLAIAGIPPLSGFFSKDEILYRTFLENKVIWGVAVVTALMTAFYMYRLMSMTFFGNYRGPAWEHGHAQAGAGHAEAAGAHGAGHAPSGEGGWHGPHESPKSMTVPLQILAVGAVVAGFVGIPAALGGGNAIEHFLEPSFVARAVEAAHATAQATPAVPALSEAASAAESKGEAVSPGEHAVTPSPSGGGGHATEHISWAAEMGLMGLSVLVGIIGILTAYRFYVRAPEIAENLARRWSGAHRVLSNKYYVDEFYGATVVNGTLAGASGLWTVDRLVVDGAVNGSGWLTVFSAWFSHLVDKYIVDGLVNLVGTVLEESSFLFRRLQTGLIQNYALVMVFGVFAFVSAYLFVR